VQNSFQNPSYWKRVRKKLDGWKEQPKGGQRLPNMWIDTNSLWLPIQEMKVQYQMTIQIHAKIDEPIMAGIRN
jgi:hypothetical protein